MKQIETYMPIADIYNQTFFQLEQNGIIPVIWCKSFLVELTLEMCSMGLSTTKEPQRAIKVLQIATNKCQF